MTAKTTANCTTVGRHRRTLLESDRRQPNFSGLSRTYVDARPAVFKTAEGLEYRTPDTWSLGVTRRYDVSLAERHPERDPIAEEGERILRENPGLRARLQEYRRKRVAGEPIPMVEHDELRRRLEAIGVRIDDED
jgi:hypothetical protein